MRFRVVVTLAVLSLIGAGALLHPAHGHDLDNKIHLEETCLLCAHTAQVAEPQVQTAPNVACLLASHFVPEQDGSFYSFTSQSQDLSRAPPFSLA